MLMKFAPMIAAIALCLSVFVSRPAIAQSVVSIELVLAVDTSVSVSDAEYQLQMRGIAEALRSREVMDQIAALDGVAMTLIQWASWTNEQLWLPWRRLQTSESVLAFAQEVEQTDRNQVGYLTGIGSAMEAGLRAIAANGFEGKRKKIDISSDGRNNIGTLPVVSKSMAQLRGVTVNGLAILTDDDRLVDYFERNVITGPDAFVIKATNYDDFARAMKIKLLRELSPVISDAGAKRQASVAEQ